MKKEEEINKNSKGITKNRNRKTPTKYRWMVYGV
jgi:hypothetical protein